MSQTVVRPPRGGGRAGRRSGTPLVPATSPATPPPAQRARGRLARALETTPGRMRAAALVGVLVCLVFAGLGGNAFLARGAALDEARADAAQLVRVQQIAIDVANADALVTNAFLLGAGEPTVVVSQYQAKIDEAGKDLAGAAQAEPGDAQALGAANAALARYTSAVASARANNRLGYQVGSGYLRQASNLLRTPTPQQAAVLPTLDAVAKADAARVDDAFGAARQATIELLIAGIVVVAGLLAVQLWLARRTRRILNIPLTWGSAAVLLCLVAGLVVLLANQSAADKIRDTSYTATSALSSARIAAFDARANEALTLVYQGSGQTYEATYKTRLGDAQSELALAGAAGVSNTGSNQLASWNEAHATVRTKDEAGDWTGAVAQAAGVSQKAFDAFDSASDAALQDQARSVRSGLDDRHWLLVLLGWVTLLAGLFAAATAAWGVSQRLGEYR